MAPSDHHDAASAAAAAAAGGTRASNERAPASTRSSKSRSGGNSSSSSSSSKSRSGSGNRRGHRRARNGGRAASSDERWVARVAAAGGGASAGRRGGDAPRGARKEDRLRWQPQGDGESLLAASDGETAAAELRSSPLLERSGGEGWKREGRDRTLEEASGDGGSGISSIGSSSAREPVTEEGAAEEGSTAASAAAAESGSLFELRDALRSREKELLRLKRDVAVVATSAGGFKHLAASLGSSIDTNSNTAGGRSFAFDDHRQADGDRSESRPGGATGRLLFGSGSGGGGGADGASGVVDGLLLLPPPRPVEASLAESSASHPAANMAPPPLTDSPRRLMPPPPPRRRQQQQQEQQHLTAASAGGAALVAVSGSPLVASAHEGLRQMRAVLEQRALETERAKDDSKNMVSWGWFGAFSRARCDQDFVFFFSCLETDRMANSCRSCLLRASLTQSPPPPVFLVRVPSVLSTYPHGHFLVFSSAEPFPLYFPSPFSLL